MKPKVAVIGLAIVVVAFVLLLVYAGVRPEAAGAGARSGVDRALGWLRSTRAITFDDLAATGAACVDPEDRVLAVASGASCAVDLPDSGSLSLCAQQGSATVAVDGADYPAQRFGPGELECPAAPTIDLYDRDNRLSVACALGGECRLTVRTP